MLPRRVLFVLPQSPYDPGSGAALATLDMLGVLAARADLFRVRVLCTTSTEATAPPPPLVLIAARGHRAEVDRRGAAGKARPLLRWNHGAGGASVPILALDTAPLHPLKWEALHAPQFNRLLLAELTSFQPDIVVTYGGSRGEQLRRQAIWEFASHPPAVVQLVHNLEFLHPDAFQHSDAVWVPSTYSAQRYQREAGVQAVAIYPPLVASDVVAPQRESERVLFVSPTPAKGGYVVMRLLHELRTQRPDIPVVIIEGRASARALMQAAAQHDLKFDDHPRLLVTPSVPRPRDVFARARVLVMPSVWSESFGKLAAEAMLNGVPALVTDRGGLPEAVGRSPGDAPLRSAGEVRAAAPGAGFVLPVPREMTSETQTPLSAAQSEPWLAMIARLCDEPAFYEACAAAARALAPRFDVLTLAPRILEFFGTVQRTWTPRF